MFDIVKTMKTAWQSLTQPRNNDSVPLDEMKIIYGGAGHTYYGYDHTGTQLANYDGYKIERSPQGQWNLIHWYGSTQASETTHRKMATDLSFPDALVLLRSVAETEGKRKHGRNFKMDNGPNSLAAAMKRIEAGERFPEPVAASRTGRGRSVVDLTQKLQS